MLETLEDQELKENIEVMRNLQLVIKELKVTKSPGAPSLECSTVDLKVHNTEYCGLPSVVVHQNESEGIAASIDAMAAGDGGADVSRNGSKNDDSASVRWLF